MKGGVGFFEADGAPGRNYDILVTNAGRPPPGDFREWDEADWLKAVNANMYTPIALMKAVADGMAERGSGGSLISRRSQ
jgi:3-oxoacyl-[acyl-carrier protein] reductase